MLRRLQHIPAASASCAHSRSPAERSERRQSRKPRPGLRRRTCQSAKSSKQIPEGLSPQQFLGATSQPLTEQIAEAQRTAQGLLVSGDGGEGQREVVATPFVIQAAPRLPLPPALRCCIVTAPSPLSRPASASGPDPLILRRVRLESSGGPALEVSEGTACELYDCFVNGSVKLARSASAKLVRTHVFGAAGSGVEGRAFAQLVLAACTIRDCVGNGLLLRHGQADISDCTISNCGQSGLVLGPGTWRLSGNTLSSNGQYGVWAEAGTRAEWRRSLCTGNLLGDRGGRGELAGWQGSGLAPHEECRIWSEPKGKWIRAEVRETAPAQDEVVVAIRKRKLAASPVEPDDDGPDAEQLMIGEGEPGAEAVAAGLLKVPAAGVRPLRSGGREPPAFSQKAAALRFGGYALFLASGGSGRDGWQQLSEKSKAKFRADSRRERRSKLTASKDRRRRLKTRARAATALVRRSLKPTWLRKLVTKNWLSKNSTKKGGRRRTKIAIGGLHMACAEFECACDGSCAPPALGPSDLK
eukprot:s5894_g7.t1